MKEKLQKWLTRAWLGLLIYGLYRWGRRLTHRA